MTIDQMHTEFKLLLDKGDSFDAPSFLDEEIDSFINIAQHKFVNERSYGGLTRGVTLEQDQKRRDDLRNLIVQKVRSVQGTTVENKEFGNFVTLPTAANGDTEDFYRHAINEEAIVTHQEEEAKRVKVTPITHDRYNKIIDDPFNKPDKYTVYRLDYDEDRFELIHHEDTVVNEYILRYIKEPVLVSLEDEVSSILSEHTHREIVSSAVVIALENVEQGRYQTSKIELNELNT